MKSVPGSIAGSKPQLVTGMISKIVFRAGGCTIAQLQMEEAEGKNVTVQATNGVLNGQEVGDHVELRGTGGSYGVFPAGLPSRSVAHRPVDAACQVW